METVEGPHRGKCLGCYRPLQAGLLYHPKCSKRLFGSSVPPRLDTTLHEVEEFAHKFLSKRLAVTGVQRKLSLNLDDHKANRFTIVGTLGGGYIMKPPSPDYDEMPENEDLIMHLARCCRIDTASHGLLPMKDGALAYITKRFDRRGNIKIAGEDLCQLAGLLTEQKYRSSHEQVGKIIRRYSSVPGDDVLRFFELVVFSFVIGNNDMHLKNFMLITDDPDDIRLSPAYDLLSVRLLLSVKEDPEETALTVNGKRNKLCRTDFEALGSNLGIPAKVITLVFNRLLQSQADLEDWIARSFLSLESQKSLQQVISDNMAVIRG